MHSIHPKRCRTSLLNFRDNVGFVRKQTSSPRLQIIFQRQTENDIIEKIKCKTQCLILSNFTLGMIGNCLCHLHMNYGSWQSLENQPDCVTLLRGYLLCIYLLTFRFFLKFFLCCLFREEEWGTLQSPLSNRSVNGHDALLYSGSSKRRKQLRSCELMFNTSVHSTNLTINQTSSIQDCVH